MQNLPKIMATPTLGEKKMKKYGHTTLAMHNAGESANMKVVALNKLVYERTVK